MSKLQELVNELCPDGVEYKTIESICDRVFTGGTPKTSSPEYYDGDIPWIRSGEINFNIIFKAERCITKKGLNESSAKLIKPNSVLLAMTGATVARSAVNAIETAANQSVCAMETNEDIINFKFLYYYIESMYETIKGKAQGALTSINLNMIKKIVVPVPPLPVQEEIVKILDKMTDYVTELKAELKARKMQYEYYRDKTLYLDGDKITIQELFDIKNGFTPSKSNSEFWDNGVFPWFKLDDINDKGRVLSDSYLHITQKALKKAGLFPENSIIISTSATIGEYALITTPFLCNQRFTCMTIKPQYQDRVNIKYLMHYCPLLAKYCKEHLNKSKFASVNMKQFAKFEFVLPFIEEQNRIVSILDRFDFLCNDLSSGLPAEIEARQKQYEYYRDKLLSFQKLENEEC